jgi:plasmid stabilization system protein ParE
VNARLLGAALAEAIDAADWYDQQTPGLGARFLAALDCLVATLATHPRMYARVRGAPAGREVREAMIPGFLFTAVYEVTATEVVILSVTHARRLRRPWRGRL